MLTRLNLFTTLNTAWTSSEETKMERGIVFAFNAAGYEGVASEQEHTNTGTDNFTDNNKLKLKASGSFFVVFACSSCWLTADCV